MTGAGVASNPQTTDQFIVEAALVNFDDLAVSARERGLGSDVEARAAVDRAIEVLLSRACEDVQVDFSAAEAEVTPNTGTAVLRVDDADTAEKLAEAILRLASHESAPVDGGIGPLVFRLGIHGGRRDETLRILRRLARLTAAADDRGVFVSSFVFGRLSRAHQERYRGEEPVDENYDRLMGHRLVWRHDLAASAGAPNCFLIMPYCGERSREVLKNYVTPACKMAGVVAMRSDWQVSREVIPQMLAALREEPLALAYLEKPPWNSNVMLEIGYRLAVGRPLVINRDKPTGTEAPLPFDLSNLRVIELPPDGAEIPSPAQVKASVAEITRTLRDRLQEKAAWRHPHPIATAKFFIESGDSVYLESSEEADELFGMPLRGRSVLDFIERIGKLMSRPQHTAFLDEQQKLLVQVIGPNFFKHGQVPTASVPIVLYASDDPNGSERRAYLPVIVNYWKVGGEVVLRVLYLEVTGALSESGMEKGVFRIDLARRRAAEAEIGAAA